VNVELWWLTLANEAMIFMTFVGELFILFMLGHYLMHPSEFIYVYTR